jgi:hypothetical protein
MPPNDAFGSRTTIGNVSLNQELKIDNTNPDYAFPPDAAGNQAVSLSDVRAAHAPNADKKTIAAGSKGELDIDTVLQAVDPFSSSSIIPGMISSLSKVSSTMDSAVPSTKKTILQNSLYGALCKLSNKYSFTRVIDIFNTALTNGGMLRIDSTQRSVVSTAITYLIKNAQDNGPDNIKIPVTFEQVTEIGIETPSPVVNLVPDLYIQVYYKIEDDPYPGYKLWLSRDGLTKIYTKRTIGEYYYENSKDEIYYTSVLELFADLDPYCDPDYVDPITKLPVIFTATILNSFLSTQNTNVKSNSMNKNVGNNSSDNLMDNLVDLLGYTGTIVNLIQSTQLPSSVLNQSSINSSLNSYSENMAMLKSMKTNALTAFKPTSLVNSLFSDLVILNSVVNTLQTRGLSASTIINVRNLINNIKSYS